MTVSWHRKCPICQFQGTDTYQFCQFLGTDTYPFCQFLGTETGIIAQKLVQIFSLLFHNISLLWRPTTNQIVFLFKLIENHQFKQTVLIKWVGLDTKISLWNSATTLTSTFSIIFHCIWCSFYSPSVYYGALQYITHTRLCLLHLYCCLLQYNFQRHFANQMTRTDTAGMSTNL